MPGALERGSESVRGIHSQIGLWALGLLAVAAYGIARGWPAGDILLAFLLLIFLAEIAAGGFATIGALLGRERSNHPFIRARPKLRGALALLAGMKVLSVVVLTPSTADLLHGGAPAELFARSNYLRSRVLAPTFGPADSPAFFPPQYQEEWAIGTLSMFGSALANLAFEFPDRVGEHQQMVRLLIRRMLEPDIRIFEERFWHEDALDSLEGDNGHIGYLGHLNYLLGIDQLLGGDETYRSLHADISTALARRIDRRPAKYLETFPGQIFIPDNAVVLASLALFDLTERAKARPEHFRGTIASWLDYTRSQLLDPETGIIVPWVDANGRPVGSPRGSYATWNVFYLLQIDLAFARDQASRIRASLLVRALPGACAVREYLLGHEGGGDIDSGPVIFGLSTSGTGFGMSSARALQDADLLHCLLATGELIGSTISSDAGRRYLVAPLIGDAIVLAMRTAIPWDERFVKRSQS